MSKNVNNDVTMNPAYTIATKFVLPAGDKRKFVVNHSW